MQKINPLGQRIVVKRLSTEVTRSGLALPKEVQKRSLIGQVVEVGPLATVSIGDKILFATFSGFEPFLTDEIKERYEDCLVMNCEDVLGTVIEVVDEKKLEVVGQ